MKFKSEIEKYVTDLSTKKNVYRIINFKFYNEFIEKYR